MKKSKYTDSQILAILIFAVALDSMKYAEKK